MTKLIGIAVISVLLGLGGGYVLFNESSKSSDSIVKDDSSTQMQTTSMHEEIEVDATKPIPAVQLEAMKDTKDGYNLHLTATNFTFTPEKAGSDKTAGEGHAHIYINDEKLGRIYGEWFYLPSKYLKDGENKVEVTLNANDHSDWLYNGEHIASSVIVQK